ncbi:MAG: TonB-dependent receptor [Chitinophagaceae bacterium]
MKNKFIFTCFIAFVFFISSSSIAQNELTGTIRNAQNNLPLQGVTINIPDIKTVSVSNASGVYKMKDIPAGNYLIEISYVGFGRLIETIPVKGFTKKDFILNPADEELKNVTVTGVLSATDQQKNPIPVTTINHQYLLQNSSINIIDAISKLPGVSAITDGQSIAKPVIRGLGYNRVVTVADGVPQQGQQWGDEFGIEADQNAVDRIEILKGPASLVYGSDAISGVINLLPEPTAPEGKITGDVLLNYQTNNGLINNEVHVAGNKNGVVWSARIDNIMAHAYKNKYDGYVLNSQFSNFNFDGTFGLHRNWGFTQLHFSHFNLRTGIVDGTRDPTTGTLERQMPLGDSVFFVIPTNQELKSYTPFVIHQNVNHEKIVWDNSIAVGNNRITATFAWQQNRRQENNDPTIPNISNIYYFLNSINYDLRYISSNKNNFNYSVGVNGLYQSSQNKGVLLLIPEYNLFDVGGFIIANKQYKKFSISGGIRYDVRKFHGNDNYIDSSGNELSPTDPKAIHRFTKYTSNFDGFSASLGAAYQLTNSFYLKANIARGFRAPNVAESGSNGIHDGTVVYEIGEPALTPETNLEFDFTAGFNNENLNAEINFFSNTIHHFIYPNALQSVFGGDSLNSSTPGFENAPVFKYMQSNAQYSGGEAVLDVHPKSLSWMDWYTAFSFVNAYLKDHPDSSKYPPFIPPARLQSEFKINFNSRSKIFANSYIKFGMLYSFKQTHVYNASAIYMALSSYELAASLAPTQAYSLFDAGAGTDIKRSNGSTACSIYVTVNNIFNTAYMDYMSRFKYYPANTNANPVRVGVYNMGRNLSMKLLIPF